MKSVFLCMQHAKSRIKAILSKIFEQNIEYVEVDQFSTPSFKNDNFSRKIVTSSKISLCQMLYRHISMQSFIAKPSLHQKLQRGWGGEANLHHLVHRRPNKPSRNRIL